MNSNSFEFSVRHYLFQNNFLIFHNLKAFADFFKNLPSIAFHIWTTLNIDLNKYYTYEKSCSGDFTGFCQFEPLREPHQPR
jgi:hypothetical protein